MTSRDARSVHLDAYRSVIAPPADRRERNLAALRLRLAQRGAIGRSHAPLHRRRSLVPVAVAMSLAIAAAMLLVLWGGATGLRALRDRARMPVHEAPAVTHDGPPAGTAATSSRSRGESASRVGAPASVAPPIVQRVSVADRSSVPPRRARASLPEGSADARKAAATSNMRPAREDRLRAELALVRAAQAALEREDFDSVWALTHEHASEYPNGSLSHERDAWRALAACRLHRPKAQEMLRSFVRDHADSPYLARVREACEVP